LAGHFFGEWDGLAGHALKTHDAKLYHNNHDGTFTDVTHKAGSTWRCLPWRGRGRLRQRWVRRFVCDGVWAEPFVSQQRQWNIYGCDAEGRICGVKEFSTSAAWVDYDEDGRLDLVVGNYVQWSPKRIFTARWMVRANRIARRIVQGSVDSFVAQQWDGTFSDVTKQAGLYEPTSKTLGIAILILTMTDGRTFCFRTTRSRTSFTGTMEMEHSRRRRSLRVWRSAKTVWPRAGMGVDTADYDRSETPA